MPKYMDRDKYKDLKYNLASDYPKVTAYKHNPDVHYTDHTEYKPNEYRDAFLALTDEEMQELEDLMNYK